MSRSSPAQSGIPAACVPSPGADGPLLDPGPAVPTAERARAVAEATGLPVAVLDGHMVPVRIDAGSEPVDGRCRFTGVTVHYDGVSVSVRAHHPLPGPAVEPADARQATAGGLFADGRLVVDGVTYLSVGCRVLPGGPVRAWTACAAGGWLVTVRGCPDRTGVRLLHAEAAPGPGRPVPHPSHDATAPVPVLDGRGTPRIAPVTGTATGWCSTYADGTRLWLLTGRLPADTAARLVLGDGPVAAGPVTFVRVGGRTRPAQQRRTDHLGARVVDLQGAAGPRTLVLVTSGHPQGPVPRILLTPPPVGGQGAAVPGAEDAR
ncbi:hypothetical protein [Streptomyces sp. CBMA156]|uniref:hypothetical protein n=1 Tax=Streptomyces sp. CBMA156 TaxID=1930280 RepID=UPI001661CC5F|nr:hypothetical protein [Streptomyces sp. CBMA156]MBD0670394.1 hypothetical protein [Streptomyces sp. CBMA156]